MARAIFEYHPVFAYRFIPNIKVRIPHEGGGYLIKTNNSGFRNDNEFSNIKLESYRRILLFGDSFTAGDGVSNKYRFGDLLEEKIENVECYNFGLPGSGTDQQYLIYQKYGPAFDHDVVIISIFIENIGRTYSHYRYWYNEGGRKVCYEKPYYELINDSLILKNVPPRRGPIKISSLSDEDQQWIHDRNLANLNPSAINFVKRFGMLELIRKVQLMYDNQPYKEYNNPDHPAWKLTEAILKDWIKNISKKVLIVLIPSYHFIDEMSDPSHYQQRFSELQLKTGCNILDTLPFFLQHSKKERREFRFKNDPHFTQKGHAVIAGSIEPILRTII
jgi:carbamoyltransferase